MTVVSPALPAQGSDAAQSSSPLFAPRARRVTPPSPLGLAFGPAYGCGSAAAHPYSSPAFSATSWPLLDVEVLALSVEPCLVRHAALHDRRLHVQGLYNAALPLHCAAARQAKLMPSFPGHAAIAQIEQAAGPQWMGSPQVSAASS